MNERIISMMAVALLVLAGGAGAQEATSIDATEVGVQLYRDVPQPWREYFLAAQRANLIEAPLARCLAYPDLPGNAWPAGYAAAHCHLHFDDPLPPSRVADYVNSHDLKGLEQQVERVLASHSGPNGEGAHKLFNAFVDNAETYAATADSWLAQAPQSAYALLAVAETRRGQAAKARGSAWSKDTPPEAMGRMSLLLDESESAFRRALTLRPDLIDAYIGLVSIGRMDRDAVGEWAWAQARARGVDCAMLDSERMVALQPRWGGSQMQMLELAGELKGRLASQPLRAHELSMPLFDFVDMQGDDYGTTEQGLDLLDESVRLSGDERGLRAAAIARINAKQPRNDWTRGVAELMQIGRFRTLTDWERGMVDAYKRHHEASQREAMRERANVMTQVAQGEYRNAMVFEQSNRFDVAQERFLRAAEDPLVAPIALRGLAEMWLFQAGRPAKEAADRARPFVERLVRDHPAVGPGHYMLSLIDGIDAGAIGDDELRKHAERHRPIPAPRP